MISHQFKMVDKYRILIVDNDITAVELMQDILSSKGFKVDSAFTFDDAVTKLKSFSFRVMVTDLKMPGRSGIELLEYSGKNFPEMPVIMLTAFGTIQNAVKALKKGAFDYLSKPIQIEELIIVLKKAITQVKLKEQNIFLREELDRREDFFYATESSELIEIYSTIEKLKYIDSTVLLQGESGTGKEVIARYLHNRSNRSTGNFVPINCGAIPEMLIESELFGYEKGAFTDAKERTKGKLEIADGGTLLLDEINELSLKAQVAFLRFIQEKELVPLGSSRRVSVDVRIVVATNQDLRKLVREGKFREDLFYRINILPLSIPPLRNRRKDIIPLASWFLDQFTLKYDKGNMKFSPDFEEALMIHKWPGNIRELRNCIERATIITNKEEIGCNSFLFQNDQREGEFTFENIGICSLKKLEESYIHWVLGELGNNRTLTAERLGVSVRGLRYKLNYESVQK